MSRFLRILVSVNKSTVISRMRPHLVEDFRDRTAQVVAIEPTLPVPIDAVNEFESLPRQVIEADNSGKVGDAGRRG